MVINAYHRFAAKKKLDGLNPNFLVLVTEGPYDFVKTMTVAAYGKYLGVMHPSNVATHHVSQIDPLSLDWLPDDINHIWTEDDVTALKEELKDKRLNESGNLYVK